MKEKKKSRLLLPLLAAVLVLLLAAAAAALVRQSALARIPALAPQEQALLAAPEPPPAETASGRALCDAVRAAWSWQALTEPAYSGPARDRRAEQRFALQALDDQGLAETLARSMAEKLSAQALSARRSDQVYDGEGRFREELSRAAFEEALAAALSQQQDFCQSRELGLGFSWSPENGTWQPWETEDCASLLALRQEQERDMDALAERLYQAAAEAIAPVYRSYAPLEDQVLTAPAPTAEFFGETRDPGQVAALLESVTARRLIGEEKLVWRPDLELFPGSSIRYYLDDSLLVLVWQEVEARAVGTFAEVFVADGSQLRRRIAGDEPFSFDFQTTSDFARSSRAVLALGGDFYHHARSCGICVYQGQILRYDPVTCDSCFFNADGDMLFSYRGQFQSREEAEAFIRDNDVRFSLGFGPVLVDEGRDVTPDSYPWGEIQDTYARSALGLLGPRHYLTMNINCGQPGTAYYYLATLRQAADAMLARGCVKAYTLDGGQTATTVFNGQLINPVQFGWEKPISDVIYFATAVPEE